MARAYFLGDLEGLRARIFALLSAGNRSLDLAYRELHDLTRMIDLDWEEEKKLLRRLGLI